MKNNSKRFTLAHQSPLMQDEYKNSFGAFGDTKFCSELIAGTADLSRFPEDIQTMLQLFSTSTPMLTPYFINFQQWKDHWRQSKESTSSSISGRHFGHMKVTSQAEDISFLQIALINLSIKNKSILQRWARGLSVMLQKKVSSIRVDKLRAILLLEADINAVAKILFNTRLMPTLEKHSMIPDAIIGARREKSAIHSGLYRQFLLDIANMRCKPSAIISADATNCFDRISHPFASLACQHFGLHMNYIIILLMTIQQMQMHVRTSFGISKGYYEGTKSKPFQGAI